MKNETELCNLALAHLGQEPIFSTSDNSAAATTFRQVYPDIRDEVLSEYDWPFARVITALVASAEELNGWSYVYAMPANVISIRSVFTDTSSKDPEPVDSEEIGSLIGTDAADAYVRYTRRITDAADFETKFGMALSYRLAEAMGKAISADRADIEEAGNKYRIYVSDGKRSNSKKRRITRSRSSSSVSAR